MTLEEFETQRENINATFEKLDGDGYTKYYEDNKEFIDFMWKVNSVGYGIKDGFLLRNVDDFDIFLDETAKERITEILIDLKVRLLEDFKCIT